jgi:hypothetical protein
MKYQASLVLVFTAMVLSPFSAGAQEQKQVLTNPPTVAPDIAPSRACTKSSPCQNITGQITRIEESYWIKTPDGRETHLRATPETRVDKLLKTGDNIAAQITSTGDAEAIVKLEDLPKPPGIPVPSTKSEDLRQGAASSER